MRRGLAPSRERAKADIASGRVLVSGAPASTAARLVDASEPVEVTGPPPRFVGRGGDKLDAALDQFGVSVEDKRCLDAGASTGGFTDCLLQRGAASVIAVDVGHGQLHERLRRDERVHDLERTNVRTLTVDDIGGPVDVLTADLAFISLRIVARALVDLTTPGGDLVVLVKPQFEAGRQEASKGKGVIRDPAIWRRVIREVSEAFAAAGAATMGDMASPLTGADGNVEFFLHARIGEG